MSKREERIRIALQKNGKLSERSHFLLQQSGLHYETSKDRLLSRAVNFPLDVMQVRDDDIPEYVADGVCELGIVGLNVLQERIQQKGVEWGRKIKVLQNLDFGHCRLVLAVPKETSFKNISDLKGKRIATTYVHSLQKFCEQNNLQNQVTIIEMSGSVEIATSLNMADVICDLVSTGQTLRSNNLREVHTIFESQCVLIQSSELSDPSHEPIMQRFLQRLTGVLKAQKTKYIMMHVPLIKLAEIQKVLPGMENPTILSLSGDPERVAVHAVSHENVFWETMEKLKNLGASSILVLPIEKIID